MSVAGIPRAASTTKLDAELAEMVDDTPTTLCDLYGVGTIITALVLGEVGDVARFRDRNHFASYMIG